MSDLRVTVLDTWDEIRLPRLGAQTLAELKRTALDAARVTGDPAAFMLKFGGAELRDESQSVDGAGLPDDAAVIVLRRRRRAVR